MKKSNHRNHYKNKCTDLISHFRWYFSVSAYLLHVSLGQKNTNFPVLFSLTNNTESWNRTKKMANILSY